MPSESIEQFTKKLSKTNDFLRDTFNEDVNEAAIACVSFIEAVIAGAKTYEDAEEGVEALCDDMKENLRKLYKKRSMQS